MDSKLKKCHLPLIYVVFVLVAGYLVWFWACKTPVKAQKTVVDVLLIGDSITNGWNLYPRILTDNYDNFVAVQGVNGIDTLDLYTIFLPTDNYRSRKSIPWYYSLAFMSKTPSGRMHFTLKNYQPRVVVLEIGVNNWMRTLVGNEKQIQNYKVSRNYKKANLESIQEDAATGSINRRSVFQIIMQIRELYGTEIPIVLVGAFPTYQAPFPVRFNSLLKEFAEDKANLIFANITYLDTAPIVHIGWSEEYGMFYDHNAFPGNKEQFDSIHVDWGHLNEKGYDVYAKMLECPVKRALDLQRDGGMQMFEGVSDCPMIGAADMNATLPE